MYIRVFASKFYNESLLILLGIVLGIAVGGTATITTIVMSLDFGPGDVQAQATIQAGLIQGMMTLAAGCVAILAAAIAYLGVLRQIHLSESQHNARVTAYKIKLMLATEYLEAKAQRESFQAMRCRDYATDQAEKLSMEARFLEEPKEFSEDEWENHGMLGEPVVRKIHKCRTELRRLVNYQKYAVKESLNISKFSGNSDSSNDLHNVVAKFSEGYYERIGRFRNEIKDLITLLK